MAMSLAATVIGLLVDSVEVIKLGKQIRDYVSKRRAGSREAMDIPQDQEAKIRTLISGRIGSRLVDAFISYVEEGSYDPLMEVIDDVEKRESVDTSVDLIGRNPEVMYRRQFGRDPDYIYKYASGGLDTSEFPRVAVSVAKFLELVSNLHPLAKKRVILVMPVVIGFQIGQLVGSTARFYPLHMVRDSGYVEVGPVIRF